MSSLPDLEEIIYRISQGSSVEDLNRMGVPTSRIELAQRIVNRLSFQPVTISGAVAPYSPLEMVRRGALPKVPRGKYWSPTEQRAFYAQYHVGLLEQLKGTPLLEEYRGNLIDPRIGRITGRITRQRTLAHLGEDEEKRAGPSRSHTPYAELFGSGVHGQEYVVAPEFFESLEGFQAVSAQYKNIVGTRYPHPLSSMGDQFPQATLQATLHAEKFREQFDALPNAIKVGLFRGESEPSLGHISGEDVEEILGFLHDRYSERHLFQRRKYNEIESELGNLRGEIAGMGRSPERDKLYRLQRELIRKRREYRANMRNIGNEMRGIESSFGGLQGVGGESWLGKRTFNEVERTFEREKVAANQLRNDIYTRNNFLELYRKGIIHDYMNVTDQYSVMNGKHILDTESMVPGAPFITTNAFHRGEEFEVARMIAPGEYHFPEAEGITEWNELPPHLKRLIPQPGLGRTFQLRQAAVPEVVLRPRSMAGEATLRSIRFGQVNPSFLPQDTDILRAVETNALNQTLRAQRDAQRIGSTGTMADQPLMRVEEAIGSVNARVSQTIRRNVGMVGEPTVLDFESDALKTSALKRFALAYRSDRRKQIDLYNLQERIESTKRNEDYRERLFAQHGALEESIRAEAERSLNDNPITSQDYISQLVASLLYSDTKKRAVGGSIDWERQLDYIMDVSRRGAPGRPTIVGQIRSELMSSLGVTEQEARAASSPYRTRRLLQQKARERAREWGVPANQKTWNQAVEITRRSLDRQGRIDRNFEAPLSSALEEHLPSISDRIESDDDFLERVLGPRSEEYQRYQLMRKRERRNLKRLRESGDQRYGGFARNWRAEAEDIVREARENERFKEALEDGDLAARATARDKSLGIARIGDQRYGWADLSPAGAPSVEDIVRRSKYLSELHGLGGETAHAFQQHFLNSTTGLGAEPSPFFGSTGKVYENLQSLEGADEYNLSLTIPGLEDIDPVTVMARIRAEGLTTLEAGPSGTTTPTRIGVRLELAREDQEKALDLLLRREGYEGEALQNRVRDLYRTGWAPYMEMESRSLGSHFTRDYIDPVEMTETQLFERAKQLGVKRVKASDIGRMGRDRGAQRILEESVGLSGPDLAAARMRAFDAEYFSLEDLKLPNNYNDKVRDYLRGVISKHEADRIRGLQGGIFGPEADYLEENWRFSPISRQDLGTSLESYVPVNVTAASNVYEELRHVSRGSEVIADLNQLLAEAADLTANTAHERQFRMNMSVLEHMHTLSQDVTSHQLLTNVGADVDSNIIPVLAGEQGIDLHLKALYQSVVEDIDKGLLKRGTSMEELSKISAAFGGESVPGNRDVFKIHNLSGIPEPPIGLPKRGGRIAVDDYLKARAKQVEGEVTAYGSINPILSLRTQMHEPGMKGSTTSLGELFSRLVVLRKMRDMNEGTKSEIWTGGRAPDLGDSYNLLLKHFTEALSDARTKTLHPDVVKTMPELTRRRVLRSVSGPLPHVAAAATSEDVAEPIIQTALPEAEKITKEAFKPTTIRNVWDSVANSPNGALKKFAMGALVVGGLGAARELVERSRRNKETNEESMQGPAGLPGSNPYSEANPYMYPIPPSNPFGNSGNYGVTYMVNASGVSDPQAMIQGAGSLTGANPSGVVYYAPNRLNASYQDDPNIQGLLN